MKITVSIDVTVARADFSETTVNETVSFDYGDNPRFERECVNASLVSAAARTVNRFPGEDTTS